MVTWTTRLRRIDRVFCLIIAVSYTCTGLVATMNACKHQITKLNTQVFAGGILYQPIGTKCYKITPKSKLQQDLFIVHYKKHKTFSMEERFVIGSHAKTKLNFNRVS